MSQKKTQSKKISKKSLKKMEKYLEEKEGLFEDKKDKLISDFYLNDMWTVSTGRKSKAMNELTLPNPFQVVYDFIKEKGLKLYGGQALHEHLKRYKEGFYKGYKFPDYDVFSPNAWEHAKELANKLYDMGFDFVDAKGSILNDEQHQTYKVGVDMMYILDLTQSGCTPEQLKNKDCDECGKDKQNKCFSLFNEIPVNNLLNYNPKKNKPKTYHETYDFKKDKAIYPNKIFVCDPDWLKISMYRELSEPLSNPSRLPKVGKRLELFKHYFEYDHSKCSQNDYEKEVNRDIKPVLKTISEFIIENKLINFGASAFNMFVGKSKNSGSIMISDYKVYSGGISGIYLIEKIKNILSNNFKHLKFNTQEKIEYWKEIDTFSYTLSVSNDRKLKYNNILTIVENDTCMPYIQYNNIRYVTIDRLKYILFRAVSLPEIYKITEENPKNYECMLSHLLKIEKKYTTKHKTHKNMKKLERSKFRRFSGRCQGDEIGKIIPNLMGMWGDKIQVLKKTKFILDAPKKGYMTKIYPIPEKELKLPYKPMEARIKQHIKYHKNLSKKYKGKK